MELFRPREAIEVLNRVSPDGMQFSAAQRAIRSSFLALAWHELGDHRKELEVIREGRRALPDNPDLHSDELVALASLGRVDEMLKLRDEWQNGNSSFDRELWNPAQVNLCIGAELEAHGRVADAHAVISEADAWFRAHRAARDTLPTDVLCAFRLLVPSYYSGKLDEARAFYERVMSHDSLSLQAHEGLGAIAARRHDLVEMNRIDSWLASHPSAERARTTYSRARMATLAGQADRGMSLLTQAMREGLGYTFLVHVDPDLEPLRAKPDYRRLFALKD